MQCWMITSIRLTQQCALRASGIQNLLTAIALAQAGHGVVLWVAALERGGREAAQEFLGQAFPPGLKLLTYKARGGACGGGRGRFFFGGRVGAFAGWRGRCLRRVCRRSNGALGGGGLGSNWDMRGVLSARTGSKCCLRRCKACRGCGSKLSGAGG